MEQWEYKVVSLNVEVGVSQQRATRSAISTPIENIADVLNRYGSEGFELVSVLYNDDTKYQAFMKRKT
jgi:hypothetical protein